MTKASTEVCQRIASILEPYLGPELASPERDRSLHAALKEVLGGR